MQLVVATYGIDKLLIDDILTLLIILSLLPLLGWLAVQLRVTDGSSRVKGRDAKGGIP